MFEKMFKNVHERSPIVHCITNYVTVNDVANIILALGASPIMADDIEEVSDITSICNSLVLNIGTLNCRTIESMIEAGKTSNKLGHPIVFDPVGVGASKLRMDTTLKLLKEVKFSVIRGNASEIKAIISKTKTSGGVDVSLEDIISEDNLDKYIKIGKEVSKANNAVVAITGPIDIVTNGEKTYLIRNGHKSMGRITGTGCMLTGVIGGFIGANPENVLDSTAAAVAVMGLCGELANQKTAERALGTGSLRTYIIDYMSNLRGEILKEELKIESR
ncbi:MAG: hydroxyethylthiazole kinase [Tissierellia bacterium]|nr:hydroxyethylthiazole kinase [Tissierellia bacterium]